MASTSATACRCSYDSRRVSSRGKGKNFRGSSVVITLYQNQIDDGAQHQTPRNGKKPEYLGVQKNTRLLALCPATKNCVSTSESIMDTVHYAPPWNYNPESRKKPIGNEAAKEELLEVIKSTKPDKSMPRIADDRGDYLRVEYESPIFVLVDDVEFWFPPGKNSVVEYRSAVMDWHLRFRRKSKEDQSSAIGAREERLGIRGQLLRVLPAIKKLG